MCLLYIDIHQILASFKLIVAIYNYIFHSELFFRSILFIRFLLSFHFDYIFGTEMQIRKQLHFHHNYLYKDRHLLKFFIDKIVYYAYHITQKLNFSVIIFCCFLFLSILSSCSFSRKPLILFHRQFNSHPHQYHLLKKANV